MTGFPKGSFPTLMGLDVGVVNLTLSLPDVNVGVAAAALATGVEILVFAGATGFAGIVEFAREEGVAFGVVAVAVGLAGVGVDAFAAGVAVLVAGAEALVAVVAAALVVVVVVDLAGVVAATLAEVAAVAATVGLGGRERLGGLSPMDRI
jgi:hypothetical protein